MLSKRTFITIFLTAAVCFAGFSQSQGNVVVLQTELKNISGNAELPVHIKNLIEENLQKYTNFTTVADEDAEQKIKEQQRRSESNAHSENDSIEIGKLVNAHYALFSSVQKTGNNYTLHINFTDLTTGVHKATITSRQYSKIEALYSHPGAVDDVTLELCGRLGINLTPTQKLVLQHGEDDLSVEQQLELEKKEQERFRQQMKEYDKQIAMLDTSAQTDAETQKKKLQAQNALAEQKLKAAQERERRLFEEQKKREADMLAEASRKEASIQRRNTMAEELANKTKSLRTAKVQNLNIMGRIELLEAKRKTFSEMQTELSNRKAEIDRESDNEFKTKKAEIEAQPWRAAELSDGKPTERAIEQRNKRIEEQRSKILAQADKEKAAVEKEVYATSDLLLEEIINEYKYLEKTTVTISSVKNEKDIQYSIGTFDGNTNSWPVLLYFYNDGKESIGQYRASVSYQALTGKKPFSEIRGNFRSGEKEDNAYNEFLDTVDLYSSLFARSEPVLTFEVDYTVEPWSVPSQYRICFKELRIKDTMSEKILPGEIEKITDLEKIISFPECRISAEQYARIISPSDKNIPSYLLYEFACAAEQNDGAQESAKLMHRAADKGYTPALDYLAQKEAVEHERQTAAAQTKAAEKEQKKNQTDALFRTNNRMGFSLSGDFSPSIQNFALEVKYHKASSMYVGGGVNTWIKTGKWNTFCGYISCGFLLPLKRVCPYIEGGIGAGKIESHIGMYWYGKGGLELKVSPYISIDAFFKPQGTFYSEKNLNGEKVNRNAGAVSAGASVTVWIPL